MTSVPPVVPGESTLNALIAFLESEAASLVPEAQALAANVIAALKAVVDIVNPAGGREAEREADLAAMLANKDLAGLLVFYNDQPPHPNKSRAICAADIKLLGGTVPA